MPTANSFRAKLSKTPSVSPSVSMPTSWANNLKIAPPYTVQAGAVGLKGLRIAVDRNWDNMYGPIYDDEFQVERILNNTLQPSLDRVLVTIFNELFRLSGYSRPEGLFRFPASPAP